MSTEKRHVKHFAKHQADVEINELKRDYLPLAIEYANLLKELEVKSIGELQLKLNERSGFTNALMSATAYGLEDQYNRLLFLEKSLDGKLSLQDLTKQNDIKLKKLDEIRESYTTYYSPEEYQARQELQEVMAMFNKIPREYRKLIGFTYSQELSYTPFANVFLQ